MLLNKFARCVQCLLITVKKFLTLPDLDSFSAGLTCIAFCICDENQNKMC